MPIIAIRSVSMRLMGLAGWSGSGKTTLLARLLPLLIERGLRVSTVKHAHHGFDIDRPGKDSHIHRQSGASEVLIASGRRWALLHELRDEVEPDLPALLSHLSPVDLILIEGFRDHPHPKIEVHRVALGKPLLQPENPDILAVASDTMLTLPVPVLPLDDVVAIAGFILRRAAPAPSSVSFPGPGSPRPALP